MEPTQLPSSDPTPVPGNRARAWLIAGGAAMGLTLAGLGVAAAQTDSSGGSTTTAPPAASSEAPAPAAPAPAPVAPAPGGPRGERFHRGHKGPGIGFGGIHGEFTTRAPGGGFQTLATQSGEVTDVSASSITLKSEDGFSRSYTVDDNTLVNAGNEGIADVKKGDTVHVIAIVKDGKASAVSVRDRTQISQSRERWAPGKPAPAAGADPADPNAAKPQGA